jgi:phenylpropionate dioxygenase-like ring-hydroxylating dioxygenase large terminal subunit
MSKTPACITDSPATSPTLPGWVYSDPALFQRERTEIFFKSWQYVGWIGDVREPGDYLTADVLDQSVVVLRATDGGLRGFHNVCQHRAHRLLAGKGHVSSIVCPYHAWRYALDGSLVSARGLEKSPGFAHCDIHLAPVRVEVLADKFVFINLDPGAQPLAQLAGGLERELRSEIPDFGLLGKVPRRPQSDARLPTDEVTYEANWKIVIENCLECYHCRPLHPSFRRLIDMDGIRVRAHDLWASMKGTLADSDVVPHSARNKTYRFWWLWPNTLFEMSPGGALGVTVSAQVPINVERTRLQSGDRYGLPGAPLFEPRGYGDLNLIAEDRAAVESVQKGIGSLGYTTGRFSFDPLHGETNEEVVHRFQVLVSGALKL